MNIIEEYPYEKEMFHMIKDKINLLNEYDKLKMKCYICQQEGHYAKYCFRVHYVPDRENILFDHFKENEKFNKEFKRFKRVRFHALTGRGLMMTRLRDLIIDHPEEMKKHVQSDLFKSNSFVPPPFQNKKFLEMPRVIGARRRSRTLTGAGIPEHLIETITPTSQENSIERKELFNQHKNKVIINFVKNAAPNKLKTLKSIKTTRRHEEPNSESEEESEKSNEKDKQSEKSVPSTGRLFVPPREAKNFTFNLVNSIPDESSYIKPALQRTSTIRHLLEHAHEDIVMDMVMNYQVYFPHNNSKKIIDSINLPHKKRRPTHMNSPGLPKKKLAEIFNRSNSERHKKLNKMNSNAHPDKRGKSLFVMSRYSIWNAAKNTLKRKPTGGSMNPNISPIGLAASKNQALAGLIPHALAMGIGKNNSNKSNPTKRRLSRSLGNLDAVYHSKHEELSVEGSGDLRIIAKDSEALGSERSRDMSPLSTTKAKPSPLGKFMRRGMSLAPAFIRRGRQDTWGGNSSFNSEI